MTGHAVPAPPPAISERPESSAVFAVPHRRAASSSGEAFSRPAWHDSELRSRVVAALINSGYAALAFIGCDVVRNRVILKGSVPSYHLKQLAQEFAQRVDGVGRIDNRLQVRRFDVLGQIPG
jgi:osmotically-inducible protein OsmY